MRRLAPLASTLVLAIAAALVPAAARADVLSGAGTDPAGDVGAPGQDITAARVDLDTAGTATAALTLAGAPDPATVYTVTVGTKDGSSCATPSVVLATLGDPVGAAAQWAAFSAEATQLAGGALTRTIAGSTITLTGGGAGLGGGYDCGWAAASRDGTRIDQMASFAVSAPAPAAPAPAPAPAPAAPPAPAAAPAPALAQAPKPAKKAAALTVTPAAIAPVSRRNQRRTAKVKVTNSGTATARKGTLRLTTAKGVSASRRTFTFTNLKAGASRTFSVALRPGRAAAKASRITYAVALAGSKASVKATEMLYVGRRTKAKRPTPGGGGPTTKPAPADTGLVGRVFYDWHYDPFTSESYKAYIFIDDRWVYRGPPEKTYPTCSARTAGVDADGDPTDGCLPYTYDAQLNTLTIDGTAVAVDAARSAFKVGEDALRWYPTPAPGTRFDARLKSVVFFGMMPNQTLTETYWEFNAAGQFLDSHTTFGSTSFSNLAVVPPDSYGTYAIGEHGLMTLTYASGKVVTGVVSMTPNDTTGQTSWATEGFIMDQENFYLPDPS